MPGKTNEKAEFNSVQVGAAEVGQEIKAIRLVSVVKDPASLAADTARLETFTVTGVAAGDAVVAIPPADLEAGLDVGGAYVSAADTVSVVLENETVDAVDGASKTWKFLWFDLT